MDQYISWSPATDTAEIALPRIWRTATPAHLEDTQAIHLLDLRPHVTRVETAGVRWRRKARSLAGTVACFAGAYAITDTIGMLLWQ